MIFKRSHRKFKELWQSYFAVRLELFRIRKLVSAIMQFIIFWLFLKKFCKKVIHFGQRTKISLCKFNFCNKYMMKNRRKINIKHKSIPTLFKFEIFGYFWMLLFFPTTDTKNKTQKISRYKKLFFLLLI